MEIVFLFSHFFVVSPKVLQRPLSPLFQVYVESVQGEDCGKGFTFNNFFTKFNPLQSGVAFLYPLKSNNGLNELKFPEKPSSKFILLTYDNYNVSFSCSGFRIKGSLPNFSSNIWRIWVDDEL